MRLTVGRKIFGLLAGITALLLIARPFAVTKALSGTLQNRFVQLSDSKAGVINVNYTLGFRTTTPLTLGSVEAEFCENDPFPGTSCTVPSGFNISTTTLSSQTGTNDFSIDAGNTNAHRIVFSRVPSAVPANTFTFVISGVTNATTTGSEYVRLTLYSGAGRGGSISDVGGIAYSLNDDLNVSTIVPPHIDLCVGVTIARIDCTDVVGDSINFGVLNATTPRSGTSQFVSGSNADNGYTVTISGGSLTSGNNVLAAMNTRTVSLPGTNQFGMNLRQNISPANGADPAGAGNAAVLNSYNVPDNYKFSNGDTLISAAGPDNYRRFTSSYIVNINGSQPAGYYASTVTFVAFGNF